MKNVIYSLLFCGALAACGSSGSQPAATETPAPEAFVRISGQGLIQPDGSKLFIKGTNLGNWLNPEGYMFGFSKTNSGRFINEMFCQLVGPDFTAKFWKQFKESSSSLLPEPTPSVFRFTISSLPTKTIWG